MSRVVADALRPDVERPVRGLHWYQARTAAEGVGMAAQGLGDVDGFRRIHAVSLLLVAAGPSNSVASRSVDQRPAGRRDTLRARALPNGRSRCTRRLGPFVPLDDDEIDCESGC